jgi:hypothetical protein
MKRIALIAATVLSLLALPACAQADQLVQMGLDGAAASTPASIAVIDTAFNQDAYPGVSVHGTSQTDHDDHGTWMTGAIVDSVNGTAPGALIEAWPCELSGGIDLDCAADAVRAALDRPVRVISMSFTYEGTVPDAARAEWNSLADEAASRGVVLIASRRSAASFPASTPGIVSVGITGTSGADAYAPGVGIVTHSGCSCDAEAEGVSYSAAWTAGVAARLIGDGASVEQVRALLSRGMAVDYRELRRSAGLQAASPVSSTASPAAPALRAGAARFSHGKLTITWKGPRVRYTVRIGQRRLRTVSTRMSMRTSHPPRFVTVSAGTHTVRMRVSR